MRPVPMVSLAAAAFFGSMLLVPLLLPSPESGEVTGTENVTTLYRIDTLAEWQDAGASTDAVVWTEEQTSFEDGRMRIGEYGARHTPAWDSIATYRTRVIPGPVRLHTLTGQGYNTERLDTTSGLELTIYECTADVDTTPGFYTNCSRVYALGPVTDPGPITLASEVAHITVNGAMVLEARIGANTTQSLPTPDAPYWDMIELTGVRQEGGR